MFLTVGETLQFCVGNGGIATTPISSISSIVLTVGQRLFGRADESKDSWKQIHVERRP